jgi:predicted phage terminase large subunit-like protein
MIDDDYMVQSWDMAVKAGPEHDASVCVTCEHIAGVHYVRDVAVMRLEYPALKRAVVKLAETYNPHMILIEDRAHGQSLLQDLRVETHWPLCAIQPRGDKESRVARASAFMEAGKVALPKHASWLYAFEREVSEFPNSAHDDQVDALVQYILWVMQRESSARPAIRVI